jgi:hypothetical protein
MKNKLCLINQPAGLGDILLCQKMAYYYIDKGYNILWPVNSRYNYLNEYIGNEKINFFDINSDFEYKNLMNYCNIIKSDEFIYLPIAYADRFINHESMLYAKFIFTGIDCSDWKNFLNIKRNKQREKELEEYLKITNYDKFNLINNFYGTPPNTARNDNIKPKNKYKNLYMEIHEWDRLFDWFGVLEKAEEIHVVDSSITLLMNKINVKNVHIYERSTDKNINYDQPNDSYIHKKLFNDEWKYFTKNKQ